MRQFLIVASCALLPGLCFGAAKLETVYSISDVSAEAKTTVKGDFSKAGLLKDYLLTSVRHALENTAYVSNIQPHDGKEQKEDNDYSDSFTHRKTSHMFVSLNLPAKASLLFTVEQNYNECKPSKSSGKADAYEYRSNTSECALSSYLNISGPINVYSSYMSYVQIEKVLRDKQNVTFDLSKLYDNSGLELISRFSITSNLFEESLYKFLDFFGAVPKTQSPINLLDDGKGTSPLLLTRQRMLLGVARYLRQVNERILQ